MNKKIKEMQKK